VRALMCRNSFKRPSELNFVVWSLSLGSIRHLGVTMGSDMGRNGEARTSSICKAVASSDQSRMSERDRQTRRKEWPQFGASERNPASIFSMMGKIRFSAISPKF